MDNSLDHNVQDQKIKDSIIRDVLHRPMTDLIPMQDIILGFAADQTTLGTNRNEELQMIYGESNYEKLQGLSSSRVLNGHIVKEIEAFNDPDANNIVFKPPKGLSISLDPVGLPPLQVSGSTRFLLNKENPKIQYPEPEGVENARDTENARENARGPTGSIGDGESLPHQELTHVSDAGTSNTRNTTEDGQMTNGNSHVQNTTSISRSTQEKSPGLDLVGNMTKELHLSQQSSAQAPHSLHTPNTHNRSPPSSTHSTHQTPSPNDSPQSVTTHTTILKTKRPVDNDHNNHNNPTNVSKKSKLDIAAVAAANKISFNRAYENYVKQLPPLGFPVDTI